MSVYLNLVYLLILPPQLLPGLPNVARLQSNQLLILIKYYLSSIFNTGTFFETNRIKFDRAK